jgi:hypothetical protein
MDYKEQRLPSSPFGRTDGQTGVATGDTMELCSNAHLHM